MDFSKKDIELHLCYPKYKSINYNLIPNSEYSIENFEYDYKIDNKQKIEKTNFYTEDKQNIIKSINIIINGDAKDPIPIVNIHETAGILFEKYGKQQWYFKNKNIKINENTRLLLLNTEKFNTINMQNYQINKNLHFNNYIKSVKYNNILTNILLICGSAYIGYSLNRLICQKSLA